MGRMRVGEDEGIKSSVKAEVDVLTVSVDVTQH